MKTLAFPLAIFCTCPTFAKPHQSDVQSSMSGYWWESLTPSFKLGWVTGYAKAMDFAGIVQMGACAGNVPLYQEKYPNLDPKEIYQKLCANNDVFDYDGIAMGQFVDGIDAFYRDYRNKQLEAGWAIQYVRDAIRGKPAQDLQAEVAAWRRCSAAMQSHNAEQISKGCSVEESSTPKM